MGQSSPKKGQFSPKRGQLSPACAERAIAFLRDRHPHKTAEEVAATTGARVSAGTVKKWLSRVSAPSFVATLALISAYGPEFLTAVLINPPEWLTAARRAEEQAALEAEQNRISTALKRLGGP